MVVGIDPGLTGGIAITVECDGCVVCALRVMPRTKAGVDAGALAALLVCDNPQAAHVYLESAAARPGQGVSSMFSFGRALGVVEGVVAALGYPCTLVAPRRWQNVMLAGCPGETPKERALVAAARLFPSASFLESPRCRKPHGGLVDARLIAEYGRRVLSGRA
jgi:crossover junction endodeoxyribonuclease RuvC